MKKTNAGYEIIQEEMYSEKFGICLGRNERNSFVTWHFAEFGKNERSYFWGHYIEKEAQAKCDYHQRLAMEYESNYNNYNLNDYNEEQ